MLVIVGYVRIEKGRFYRHGERIARVRREKMGKKVEGTPCSQQFTPGSVIRRRRAINAFTPVAGSSRTPSTGTLVQTPFLYLRIPQ
jgi:hypothetical protein